MNTIADFFPLFSPGQPFRLLAHRVRSLIGLTPASADRTAAVRHRSTALTHQRRHRGLLAFVVISHEGDIGGAAKTPEELVERLFANSRMISARELLRESRTARQAISCVIPAGQWVATPEAAARQAFAVAQSALWPWEVADCKAIVIQRPSAGLLAFVVKIGDFPPEEAAPSLSEATATVA